MNEYIIGFAAVGALIGLSIGSALYMMGGRNNKALRRFVASAIMTTTVCVVSKVMGVFSWWLLLLYPLLVFQFIQGYSNNKGKGWLKRLGISATAVIAGLAVCIIFNGGYQLIFLHGWIALVTCTFAFKNPMHAAAEEVFVCFFNNIVLMCYPFVVGLT